MKEKEYFAKQFKESIKRAIYRGPNSEIPSLIYDTINILYAKAPIKPFIFKKKLLSPKEKQEPQLPKPNLHDILHRIIVRPKLRQTWLLAIHLPPGISFSEFKANENYYSTAIGNGSCEIEQNGSSVLMLISNIPLEREYTYSFDPTPYLKKMKLPILIGNGANGPVIADLTVILSLLVVGLRGKGKSTLMHQVIYTLLILNKSTGKDYTQVAIIGPKNKEFEYFEDYGAVFAHEEGDYLQLLKLIDKSNEHRKNKLGRCRDILEYNRIKGNHMPYCVLLVDECDMVGENKECAELLLRSVKKYRSQGIYCISATQRPSAKAWGNNNLFTEYRSQFEARIAFHMADKLNSQMILESDKAALIPKTPGRAIYKYDTEVEVQTPLFPSQGKRFNSLMEQLPKIPLPYHDIEGKVYEHESNYPRKRQEARSTSSDTSRSLKALVSGANPFT